MLTFAPLETALSLLTPAGAALTALFTPVAGPAAGAAAIVALTLAMRLLVAPLSYLRVRAARRRARLAPEIAELHRRHGADPARLAAELSALGAGPLGGCLPTLLQAPVFFVTYRLCSAATVDGRPNALLGGQLAGLPLGESLTAGLSAGPGWAGLAVAVAMLLVATTLAWWSSRRLRAATLPGLPGGAPTAAGAGPGRLGRPAGGRGSAGAAAQPPDVARVLHRVLPLLPYAALLALPVVPLAAALHLVTTTAVTVLEQALMPHPAPPPAPPA